MTPQIDEQQMMDIVKGSLHHALAIGDTHAAIPVGLLEQLIEKAERPHD